jgi:hypothetical protein
LNSTISRQYQAILDVREDNFALSTASAFSFEHFLPWVHKIILLYQEQKDTENDIFLSKDTGSPKHIILKK